MLAGLLVLTVLAVTIDGHSYHLGACPSVEPFAGFDVSKFLGEWYVIQKTSKNLRCLTYNFTSTSDPNKIILEQTSEHSNLRRLSMGQKYRFSGDLTVPSADTPAKMLAKLPLGAGSAAYTVFDTDYNNYGAVFACQSLLGLGNRQAATILSRYRTLDDVYLNQIRSKLVAFGIETSELSVIDQHNCHGNENPRLEVQVEDENLNVAVRKNGAQKQTTVVKDVTDPDDIDPRISTPSNEEIVDGQQDSETEWIP